MRDYLRRVGDAIWVIDCSPEGHQPEVATRVFQGVQQPVCIVFVVKDGTTDEDTPAHLRCTSITGRREQKFEQLAALSLDGSSWKDGAPGWRDPLLPRSGSDWESLPALEDILAWSGSGTMPGRTWVISPSASTLRSRWRRLVSAAPDEKPVLLKEHTRDRTINTVLTDNLPGYEPKRALALETGNSAEPVRYAYQSFDRQWIIPDKRVINQPNPGLWQVRSAPGQVFITVLSRTSPTAGPALTACGLVPDLDHYRGSFGGRVYPLFLDASGTAPNVVPGLLDLLGDKLGEQVSGAQLFAYIAALVAAPAYVAKFGEDLAAPGLRIPLTAEAGLFTEAVALGERILWLHTYGECFVDPAAGRPKGPPLALLRVVLS